MADTTTTNLGLTKPEVGASADTWGGKLNTNLDTIDGIFAGAGSGTSVGLNVGTGKTLTVGGTQNMSALTASTALALDASKNVVSVTNTGTGNNVLSASPTFTGTISGAAASLSGNLTFSSTGQRITGDMSNATFSSRLAFQSSTTNGNTILGILANGTPADLAGTGVVCNAVSDTTNTQTMSMFVFKNLEASLRSNAAGTGTYLPMTFYTGGSERMRLDTSGNLGLGGTANGAYKLNVLGTYPSGSNTTGVVIADGTIPSASTAASNTFVSVPSTQAASFTVSNLRHFYAVQGTIGAGSAVTNQVGFLAESNLTGATNNFGFYSNIASGTNRFNFYANGTADNYFAGNVGIGTASPSNKLQVSLDANSGSGITVSNANTGTSAASLITFGTNIDASMGYIGVKNGAGTDANQLIIANRVAHGIYFRTNDTNRMYIDSSGNVGIGGTAAAFVKMQVSGTLPTGSNVTRTVYLDGTIPSGTTSTATGFHTALNTQAASFTNANLVHFYATQGTFGAGSTVTSQYGFFAENNLTGATNNYGFYSNIASGTNRWNFFANGTANNHFNGDVFIGTTSTAGSVNVPIYVRGGGVTWQLGPDANGNFVVYNNNDAGVYVTSGNTSWTANSDERIKTDLVPIADALNKVSSLRTVTGRYIKDAVGISRSFLIAQDVQAVFPEAVDVPKKDSDPLGLRYTDVVPLLVAAIKELSAKVAVLEAK